MSAVGRSDELGPLKREFKTQISRFEFPLERAWIGSCGIQQQFKLYLRSIRYVPK